MFGNKLVYMICVTYAYYLIKVLVCYHLLEKTKNTCARLRLLTSAVVQSSFLSGGLDAILLISLMISSILSCSFLILKRCKNWVNSVQSLLRKFVFANFYESNITTGHWWSVYFSWKKNHHLPIWIEFFSWKSHDVCWTLHLNPAGVFFNCHLPAGPLGTFVQSPAPRRVRRLFLRFFDGMIQFRWTTSSYQKNIVEFGLFWCLKYSSLLVLSLQKNDTYTNKNRYIYIL